MANANLARGFMPAMHRNGAHWNGAYRVYYVPSTYNTALYIGDPVIIVTASTETLGIPIVGIATAGGGAYAIGSVVGVMTGGNPAVPVLQSSNVYHPASTAGYVAVADDPDLLFEAQEDGLGGAMGIGCVGRNVDMIAGTGSTTSGYSGWMLDSSTLQTTATLQMRIVYPVIREDNDPTLTLAKWLVSFNLHSLRNTSGI